MRYEARRDRHVFRLVHLGRRPCLSLLEALWAFGTCLSVLGCLPAAGGGFWARGVWVKRDVALPHMFNRLRMRCRLKLHGVEPLETAEESGDAHHGGTRGTIVSYASEHASPRPREDAQAASSKVKCVVKARHGTQRSLVH